MRWRMGRGTGHVRHSRFKNFICLRSSSITECEENEKNSWDQCELGNDQKNMMLLQEITGNYYVNIKIRKNSSISSSLATQIKVYRAAAGPGL